jgi:hypothetical protein
MAPASPARVLFSSASAPPFVRFLRAPQALAYTNASLACAHIATTIASTAPAAPVRVLFSA